ncbi:hypothetical protein CsSME_00016501 [Camellia sinensis var. sinensis]
MNEGRLVKSKAKQSSRIFLFERFVTCGSQSLETTGVDFVYGSRRMLPPPVDAVTFGRCCLGVFFILFLLPPCQHGFVVLLCFCKHKVTGADGFVKAIWVRYTISFKLVAWVSL